MSFRKIDVDAYDEDVLQETELYDPDPRDPAQVLSDAKQKQLAVRSALNRCLSLSPLPMSVQLAWLTKRLSLFLSVCRGDISGALSAALDSPPYGPNVEEAKVRVARSPIAHLLIPIPIPIPILVPILLVFHRTSPFKPLYPYSTVRKRQTCPPFSDRSPKTIRRR